MRKALTILEMLIALVVLGLIFLVLLSLQDAQSRYGTHDCSYRLETIAQGLSSYLSNYVRLPNQNEPSLNSAPRSWRVDILLNHGVSNELSDYRKTEPWNSQHNLKLASRPIAGVKNFYHCPKDPGSNENTSYLSLEGEKTWYTTAVSGKVDWDQGKTLKNYKQQIRSDKSGISNTIAVLEVHQSGIHWMEPKDLSISDLPTTYSSDKPNVLLSGHSYFSGRPRKGTFALFSDGSVRFLNATVDRKILRSLVDIDHPEKPTERFDQR